jgi:hypothetical protein
MEQTSNEAESKHAESSAADAAAWQQKVLELEQLQAELAREKAALRAERDAFNAQRQQLQQSESTVEEDDDDRHAPSVEQSAGRRQQVIEQDEDLEADEPDFQSQPSRASQPQPAPRGSDEEESIEDYMAALLTRMRGGAPASVIIPEPARRPKRAPEPVQAEEPKAAEPSPSPPPIAEEVPVIVTPTVARDLERRPKREVTDLSAMRELANAHARMAIHTHGRKQVVNMILIRSGAAIGCLAAGFVALRIWPFENQILFGCGMAGIVVGIYCMFAAASDIQKVLTWFESRDAQAALESDQTPNSSKAAPPDQDVSQPASV